jgi:meiotic recombination protein DMC1
VCIYYLTFARLIIVGCGKTQLAHTMAVIAQLPKVSQKSHLLRELLTLVRKWVVLREKLLILVLLFECLLGIYSNKIDTEGTFRPERIQEIAERFGGWYLSILYLSLMLSILVDPEQACENIVYARAQNSEVQPSFDLCHLIPNQT